MNMNKQETNIESVIRGRRTIHNFRPGKKPDIELIKSAIEVARWAPNHHLTEPWHFYLLGPETAEAICQLISEITREKNGKEAAEKKLRRWRSMPGWLLVSCDLSSDSIISQEDYAACCCAIQNLSLYLWNKGIGVKWTTGDIVRNPHFYDLLQIDATRESVVGLLWYGYPEKIPSMNRSPAKGICVELP